MTTSPALARLSRDRLAVLAGLLAPVALAAILVPFRSSIPNTDAALAMILVVVAVAANGYRLAGILAALSVAVWFDFFLTQPYETFSITRRNDIETTVLLLVIGIAVTEIAVWGRRQHTAASRRAGYLDGINSAAQAVAAGGSASALIEQVTRQLTQLLSLRSCSFQRGVAGIGLRDCGTTVRSPSGSEPGMWTPRASRPVRTRNCWWRAAACSRAGS